MTTTTTPRIASLLTVVLGVAPLAPGQTGLVVVAHGATRDWNDRVRQTVAQVRWPHGPVAAAFLTGPEAETAGWNLAVAELQGRGIRALVVMPLMVSSFGAHFRQVEYYAGQRSELLAELAAHRHELHATVSVPVRVTAALDTAAELLDAVEARWSALDPRRQQAPLVMVAHGTNDDADAARWTDAMDRVLGRLRTIGDTGPSLGMLLRDDAPASVLVAAVAAMRDSIAAFEARGRDSVTVMTLLVAQDRLTQRTIPSDPAGLPVRYVPMGLTPLPAIARWIERSAEAARRSLTGER